MPVTKEMKIFKKLKSFARRHSAHSVLPLFGIGTTPPADPTPAPEPPLDPVEASVEKDLEDEPPKEQENVTDPILQVCAATLQSWFRTIHSGMDINECFKSCARPSNADALKLVDINPEVKKKMFKGDDISDQRMKWISNAAIRSAQPLSIAWSNLLKLEFVIKACQENEIKTDAMIPLDAGQHFNLSESIRLLKHGIKCLGMTSMQAVQKRRLDLRYKLIGAAKELAEPNQPFDDTIFGPNLQRHFTNILQGNKISGKIARSSPKKDHGNNRYHPFIGRGRGRNRSGTHGQFHNDQSQFHQYPLQQFQQYPPPNYYQQQYTNNHHNYQQPASQNSQRGHKSNRGNQQRGHKK